MPEQNNRENVKQFLSNSVMTQKMFSFPQISIEIWWWLLVVLPCHGSSLFKTVHLSGVKQILEFPQHPDKDKRAQKSIKRHIEEW